MGVQFTREILSSFSGGEYTPTATTYFLDAVDYTIHELDQLITMSPVLYPTLIVMGQNAYLNYMSLITKTFPNMDSTVNAKVYKGVEIFVDYKDVNRLPTAYFPELYRQPVCVATPKENE